MMQCQACNYNGNPDTAAYCVKCRAPLARRGDTFGENSQHPAARPAGGRRTVVEGYSFPASDGEVPVDQQPPTELPPIPTYSQPPARPEHKLEIPSIKPLSIHNLFAHKRTEKTEDIAPSAPEPSAQPSSQYVRRSTQYAGIAPDAAASSAGGQSAPNAVRKIVGILVSYSWEEQGMIAYIYEGRNIIGRDPAHCDIVVPQDTTLSAINSSITFRRQFVILDKDSMSGTDVDGSPVEADPVPLRNYAQIRTGSTYWTFVSLIPPA